MNCSSVRNRPIDLRAGFDQVRHVDQEAGVHVEPDPNAVEADRRHVAERAKLRLLARAHTRPFGVGRLDVRRRAQIDLAGIAVDDDRVAVLDNLGHVGDVADRRDRQRPRDDRDMTRGAPLLEHQAAQTRSVVIEQSRRAHRPRDQNCVFRQFLRQQHKALARELMQQSVGDIGEIVQPVAQIGIRLPLQLGARVVLDPLDRGFGGQPRTHRFAQPAQPASVMRDHPEGFQHVAMFARPAVVTAVDQLVDRGAHGADRRLRAAAVRNRRRRRQSSTPRRAADACTT